MKKLLISTLLFLSFKIVSQNQTIFPEIHGTSLDDKHFTIPQHNNKYTLLAIAFSRGAEDDLRRWLNPLYETFVKKEQNSGGLSSAEVYDVNFFFIPLISGFKKHAEDFKKGTDKEFWQYIIDTEKTDVKGLQKKLGLKDADVPYFFVLDKDGKIIEVQSGTFQTIKLDKLEDAIE